MSKRPITAGRGASALSTEEKPTEPAAVAEGRRVTVPAASAAAIAAASEASGFPAPPQLQAAPVATTTETPAQAGQTEEA